MGSPALTGLHDRLGAAASRAGRSGFLILGLSILLFLALAPFTPALASKGNALNLVGNLVPLFVVATGLTVVLISGGMDLSLTSIIALTSVVGAMVMNGDTGWLAGSPLAAPTAVAVMLLLGAAAGLINGVAVALLRMPAFIVTLTTMMFFSGLAIWISQSKPVDRLPDGFIALGSRPGIAVGIAAVLGGWAHLMLTRSLFGRWLHAVGQNPRTARVSGVPVAGVLIAAYVVSGVFAAAASVLYTARLETGSPVHGQRLLLDVLGATVIGGTSLFGGRGRVAWTLCGVLFLTLLDNALNLLGLSHFTIMMVKGGVILLAALLDGWRSRMLYGS
ncbi:MAG: ABC transporter permease [Verrucomicrobiae bacterium]|nr:ABC transporter permease [Verrucomicrobiae bacterium]